MPLRESRVAIREGPQKNRKRANLALYFYKAAGLTQHSISVTNMPFLEAKNSGLAAIITTSFLYVDDQQRLFSHTLCSSRKAYWKIFASKTLNIEKEVNISFCFAVLILSPCLKSPYNALQTLDYWLRHLCLCIVPLAPFLRKLAPKTSLQGPLWPSSKIFWLKH